MTAAIRSTVMGMMPERRSRLPTGAFLQLSDRCNHACTHCYQVHNRRGELTTVEVKRVLDELASAGTLFVTFTGGEVTLRDDLLELISYARGLRFAVRIFTNAYLIDDVLARALKERALLEAHVSVYSARPEDHDAITLVPGSLERTVAGIRAMRSHDIRVVIKMPFMKVNSETYRDVIGLARELGCEHRISPTIDVREDGHRSPTAMRASEHALRRLIGDPVAGFAPPGKLPPEKRLDEQPCGACAVAYVTPDGTIRPCTSLPFSLGNVRDGSLAQAYGDSAAHRFVLSLRWKDLPACARCDLKDYCARCHANALLEDGDVFGPSRAACEWARVRFHHANGTQPGEDEPRVGPFEVGEGGHLSLRAWERGDRAIPADVRSALVYGRERGRVRLRVVPR